MFLPLRERGGFYQPGRNPQELTVAADAVKCCKISSVQILMSARRRRRKINDIYIYSASQILYENFALAKYKVELYCQEIPRIVVPKDTRGEHIRRVGF